MSRVRFRYGLQPLLLTRTWELDELRRELGDCNALVARHEAQAEALRERMRAADGDWERLAADGRLAVDQFVRYLRYRADLGAALAAEEAVVEERKAERAALAERLGAAKRALEAVEEHRDDMKALFLRERMRGELKAADDHWNILQAGRAGDAA